jgi:hypothetical protein
VPFKLERTVTAGMLVCADSFLFNFTLLPLRAASALLCLLRAILAGGRLPRSAPGTPPPNSIGPARSQADTLPPPLARE